MIRLAASCLAALLLATGARATTYYVRTSGNDGNAGTSKGAAWATVQHAGDTVVAGDVVYVGAGTYTKQCAPANDGTAVNPIRFIADKGGSQTDDPGTVEIDVNGNHAIELDTDDYIEFVGFRIGSTKRAVSWMNSTGGVLQDCDIFQAGDEALYI